MTDKRQIEVELPVEVIATMQNAVDDGTYESFDDLVDHALRDWLATNGRDPGQTAQLRRAIERSDASGPSVPAEQVYAELRARIEKKRAA